jgi:hypothetical protein
MTFFLTVPTFSLTLVILSSVLLMSTGILGYHAKYTGYKFLYNPNLYAYISLFSIIFVITIFSTLSLFDVIFSSIVSLYSMGMNILESGIHFMSNNNEIPANTGSGSSPGDNSASNNSPGSGIFDKKNVNYIDIAAGAGAIVGTAITSDPVVGLSVGGMVKLVGQGGESLRDALINRAIDHPSSVVVNRVPSPGLGETGGDRFFHMKESDYPEAPHIAKSKSINPVSSVTSTSLNPSDGKVVTVEVKLGKEVVNTNKDNPYSGIPSINEEKSQL